jgi:hypothetical protein
MRELGIGVAANKLIDLPMKRRTQWRLACSCQDKDCIQTRSYLGRGISTIVNA